MDEQQLMLLDMLSLIYEDMDIDVIEERFVNLVSELFSFDRVGLFFVKHRKGVLQGKLCKGFEPGTISSVNIPVSEEHIFTKPLITGFPVWREMAGTDRYIEQMGLENYALFPLVSRRRISCWRVKKCKQLDCPAHGNKWLRCWLVANTRCCDGRALSPEEKQVFCEQCEVFAAEHTDDVEGVLLVDNDYTKEPIDSKTITILSIIAHAVGNAINNTKAYSTALRDAIYDELTGLHNRRYFKERLLEEIERSKRYESPISLLFCDIDYFKKVNDTFGHPVGDDVLAWFSKVLQEKLRVSDILARYGGEEFAVMLLNTNKGQALEIAENLRGAIAGVPFPHNDPIWLTVSIGVATLGEDASSFEGLIKAADKGLYSAKTQGRNRVR